ncbi:MAG TPA: T9SS type A sorting domain-containing protein, partial [Chitinophagales bacterium]|nr:T9SS type A sorting domain-containing protein [Chitinophagales bacterium]
AMIPYQMQQADSLFALSQSIMQFYNSSDYQYMLGSDVFVAPITSSSNDVLIGNFPGNNTTWVYLFDNTQTFQSGSSTIISTPLDQFPVFIKSTSPLLQVLDSVVSSITSVSEVSNRTGKVLVYPNPANNEIHLSGLEFNGSTPYEFTLFDALGRVLVKTSLTTAQSTVRVDEIENGIYFYAVSHPTFGKVSGNITIQR